MAPAPSASISAKDSFCEASRSRPLDPTQIAPQLSTAGSSALASPPAMGSSARAFATLFDTTTRLMTLVSDAALTTFSPDYGSWFLWRRNIAQMPAKQSLPSLTLHHSAAYAMVDSSASSA